MKSLCLFVISLLSSSALITAAEQKSYLRAKNEVNFSHPSKQEPKENESNKIEEQNSYSKKSEGGVIKKKSSEGEVNAELNGDDKAKSNAKIKTDWGTIPEPKVYEGNCFIRIHKHFYNLWGMNKIDNLSYQLKSLTGRLINFNICQTVNTDCTNSKGLVVDQKKCVEYADTWKKDKVWEVKADEINKTERLILTLPSPKEKCKGNTDYTTKFDIRCDPNENTVRILNGETFDPLKCNNTIKMVSMHACKREEFRSWYSRFGVSKYIVGSLLGILGLYFLFFGQAYFKFNSSVIIIFSTALIIKAFFNAAYEVDFLVCLVFGVLVSWLVKDSTLWINRLMGIIIGYFMGMILYNFVIKVVDMDPNKLHVITILTCIVIVFIFAQHIEKTIQTILTSLVGSYASIRGASIILGGFPDETYSSKLIVYKEFNQLGRVFGGKASLYLLSMLAMFIIGAFFQSGIAKLCEKEEKNENDQEKDKNLQNIDDEAKEHLNQNEENTKQEDKKE